MKAVDPGRLFMKKLNVRSSALIKGITTLI